LFVQLANLLITLMVVFDVQKVVFALLAYESYAQAANSPATKAQTCVICAQLASTAALQAWKTTHALDLANGDSIALQDPHRARRIHALLV
jgi:hypothetical protein